jgi:DNA polymerase
MSQLSARSEIFLGEMGIGMQWKLRNPAPVALAEEMPPAEEVMDAASTPAAAVSVAAAATVPAAATPHPSVSEAPAIQHAQAPVAAAVPHVPRPVAPPAQHESAAWAEPEVSQPVPAAAPARAAEPVDDVPYVADAADAGEDTAWFDDVPAAPVPARTPASGPPARAAQSPVSEEAIADMDWDELQAAVASCTRCGLCATRRQAVPGRGAPKATWLAIAAAPSAADEDAGQAISGEAGQLLDNMLKAVALSTESNAYITTLVKCRPQTEDGADRLPSAEEVMACRPFLEREMALSGATMSLTLGQLAAKGLLGVAARGKVHHYGTLPVVATYHPDDLLRKPQDKAKAWADLCLARDSCD